MYKKNGACEEREADGRSIKKIRWRGCNIGMF